MFCCVEWKLLLLWELWILASIYQTSKYWKIMNSVRKCRFDANTNSGREIWCENSMSKLQNIEIVLPTCCFRNIQLRLVLAVTTLWIWYEYMDLLCKEFCKDVEFGILTSFYPHLDGCKLTS